ncbi:hypothetical protein C8Q70DRAFT_1011031, partial [Cubamyces menziesii]
TYNSMQRTYNNMQRTYNSMQRTYSINKYPKTTSTYIRRHSALSVERALLRWATLVLLSQCIRAIEIRRR